MISGRLKNRVLKGTPLVLSYLKQPRMSIRGTRMSMALLDREEGDEMRKELDLAKAELLRLRREQGRNKILEKENGDLEGVSPLHQIVLF